MLLPAGIDDTIAEKLEKRHNVTRNTRRIALAGIVAPAVFRKAGNAVGSLMSDEALNLFSRTRRDTFVRVPNSETRLLIDDEVAELSNTMEA